MIRKSYPLAEYITMIFFSSKIVLLQIGSEHQTNAVYVTERGKVLL